MLALAHSARMSVTEPGSSTRSKRPRLRVSRTRCGRWCPTPRIRSRQSGSWSATSAKAATSLVNCFSITSRPAVTMTLPSSSERGASPWGRALGTTTVSGATAPSSSRSQVSIEGVSRATTSARGANASSGSIPLVRCEDDRCSWCTTTTSSGRSWTALASSAGVTVTTTSARTLLRARLEGDVRARRELAVPAPGDQHRLGVEQRIGVGARPDVDEVLDRDPVVDGVVRLVGRAQHAEDGHVVAAVVQAGQRVGLRDGRALGAAHRVRGQDEVGDPHARPAIGVTVAPGPACSAGSRTRSTRCESGFQRNLAARHVLVGVGPGRRVVQLGQQHGPVRVGRGRCAGAGCAPTSPRSRGPAGRRRSSPRAGPRRRPAPRRGRRGR